MAFLFEKLPKNIFYPTVPLLHMVPLKPLGFTTPSTCCVWLLSIVAGDIEQATHGKKISQYLCVLAIKQKPQWLRYTADKVYTNFKSLFNADGVF